MEHIKTIIKMSAYIFKYKVSKNYNYKDVERFYNKVYAMIETQENFFYKAAILVCYVVIT